MQLIAASIDVLNRYRRKSLIQPEVAIAIVKLAQSRLSYAVGGSFSKPRGQD